MVGRDEFGGEAVQLAIALPLVAIIAVCALWAGYVAYLGETLAASAFAAARTCDIDQMEAIRGQDDLDAAMQRAVADAGMGRAGITVAGTRIRTDAELSREAVSRGGAFTSMTRTEAVATISFTVSLEVDAPISWAPGVVLRRDISCERVISRQVELS